MSVITKEEQQEMIRLFPGGEALHTEDLAPWIYEERRRQKLSNEGKEIVAFDLTSIQGRASIVQFAKEQLDSQGRGDMSFFQAIIAGYLP